MSETFDIKEYKDLLSSANKVVIENFVIGGTTEAIAVVNYVNPDLKTAKYRARYRTVHFSDPSIEGGRISANIFDRDERKIPPLQEYDIVVMKGVKTGELNDEPALTCNQFTSYAIFREEELRQVETEANECQVTQEEMKAVNYLAKWSYARRQQAKRQLENSTHSDIPTTTGRRLLETKNFYDIPGKWFNFVGMVVDFKPTHSQVEDGSKASLVLTDFTKNPKPSYYHDQFERFGIATSFLIDCTLWDIHAFRCPDLQPGDYVYLDNCSIRDDIGFLEFDMKGNNEKRPHVHRVEENDDRLVALVQRRRKWEQSRRIRTDTNNPSQEKTIKEVLGEQTTGTYNVKGYIKEFIPSEIENWLNYWCFLCSQGVDFDLGLDKCPRCNQLLIPIFYFKLMLQDKHGSSMVVNVSLKNAVDFLGMRPDELTGQQQSLQTLEKIIQLLFDPETHVFFEVGDLKFGVESFITEDGNIEYKLTNTELKVDE